jgi:hypothetical protein
VNTQKFPSVRLTTQSRAIAQAVSRRLPIAPTGVRAQVKSCGICGGQSGTGEGFLRVLQLPLPILIPPTAPHSSSSIIRGWYNRPISGRRTKWTQSHPTPRNKKKKLTIQGMTFLQRCFRITEAIFTWKQLATFSIRSYRVIDNIFKKCTDFTLIVR